MAIALQPARFPWLDYQRYAFSLGVRAGSGVWLSGNTASRFDPDAGRVVVGGDLAAQAGVAWDKVEATLAADGLDLGAVTRVVEYVTPDALARHWDAVTVRLERLGDHQPAVTTIVVDRLVRPDALIEVEVSATAEPGADGLVYLGALSAPEAGSDLGSQVAGVFDLAERLLAEFELDLGHVVKTFEVTTAATRAEYRATGEIRRARLGPTFPAATGVLVPAIVRSGALITMEVIASRLPRQVIDPDAGASSRAVTFSPAVRAGDVVFCSGATALDPRSGELRGEGDVAAQAEAVYRRLDDVLGAAGVGGLPSLVKTVELVAPAAADAYRQVGAVRERLLGRPFPASTGVHTPLLRPELLIEVDAVAVVERP